MGIIEQFMGHDAGPLIQFIKYGIAGGISTVVHIVIFHFCAWKIFPALQEKDWAVRIFKLSVAPEDDGLRSRNSMIDNAIAFIFSNMTAYIVNIFWVFEAGKHHWLVEIGLFYLVSGVSIVIGTSIMG
ncbi:GtrA family protein [PVC group bacterium]|nr:GtrA family protein [PVC group bacterium]